MASLGSWLWGTTQIDEAVDKATSELIPSGSEDVALSLEICDQIRSKSAPAKDSMRALKRRLNHKNPNVQILALGLTDTCVKNGGDHFLSEIASREFIDNLVSILKIPGLNHTVKSDILKYIQSWSLAFEGKPSLSYVGQTYKTLKSEGYDFPPKDLAFVNSAMVDTSTAPEWIDSDVCLRCRSAFTFTNRKHHCRNCGQVFDQQCSSKSIPLPHFGITQAVRVCDGCHSKISRKAERSDKGHRHSASMYSPRHGSARELFDAELQRAIQLSLQEVGASSASTKRPGYVPYQPHPSEPPIVDQSTHPDRARMRRRSAPSASAIDDEDDPDLRAAIEASLREANLPKPSAPMEMSSTEDTPSYSPSYGTTTVAYPSSYPPTVAPTPFAPSVPKLPNYDLEPLESDAILTFSQTVEQVHAQGGGDMSRYPAVGELFDKANGLRPKLAMSLDDAGRKEQLLSEMHEKLSQAVKLYDKLLTDQISRPTWRHTSPQQSRAPTLPAAGPAQDLTQGPNGYTQWTASSSSAYAPPRVAPGQAQFAPPVTVPQSPVSLTTHQPLYSQSASTPGPSYAYQPSAAESQYQVTSPPISAGTLQSLQADSQGIHAYQPVSTPRWTSPLQQNSSVLVSQPPLQSPQTALPPLQPEFHSQPQPQPQPLTQATPSAPSAPAIAPSHPPPLPPATTSNLARSATIAARPSISPPHPHTSLARSSTHVQSHARSFSHSQTTRSQPQFQHHLSQHPQQHPHTPQANAPLPSFPVVPTNNPQSFDMYAASVPTAPPQERREEMLIEL
ncbi:ubiquitin binding protein [Paxillus ammoniavirescens]|nr:ubiquitin binding protein [Paxillus ammoniavirescens]